VAVLTEPREKVERHLVNLNKARQDNQLFSLKELMELPNYPQNPRQISTFYAESVSVVDFLTSIRGPQEFMMFLQDGMRYGYEKSMQRHFNIASYTELESRWSAHVNGEQTRVAGAEAGHLMSGGAELRESMNGISWRALRPYTPRR